MRRILSIDGGGIKGTFPAAFLAELEEQLPLPIGRYFDLIAGTSTGGVLAIGLALGLSAKELHHLYCERGPEIFGQSKNGNKISEFLRHGARKAQHLFKSKHDVSPLKAILVDVIGDQRIGDALTRLLIPAWDADLRSCYVYKTAHHLRFSTDYKKSAVDAALATAAAPSYFRRHKTIDNVGLLDGGVWANNPTGTAAIEAITVLDWQPDSLRILSLGCMDEVYMLSENPGILGLALKKGNFFKLFMDGQSSNSMGTAKLITGHPHSGKRLFRYSPAAPAGFFKLDDTRKIDRLSGMGMSLARSAFAELETTFFKEPAADFVPCYVNEEVP